MATSQPPTTDEIRQKQIFEAANSSKDHGMKWAKAMAAVDLLKEKFLKQVKGEIRGENGTPLK